MKKLSKVKAQALKTIEENFTQLEEYCVSSESK